MSLLLIGGFLAVLVPILTSWRLVKRDLGFSGDWWLVVVRKIVN